MIKKDKKFDIVMFCMSSYTDWERGVSNRNFQVFNSLKSNNLVNRILLIDYLPQTKKRALRNWKENIFLNNIGKTIRSTLHTKIYSPEENVYVYSTVKNIFNYKKCFKEINDYLIKEDYKNIVLWSYYPINTDYFDSIDYDISVFDTVDNWAEHASYKKIKTKIEENYKTIRDRANIIFVLSEASEKMFYPRVDKVYHITQGIDLAHYANKSKLINNDIAKISRPIIGYLGIIQENRVNLDMVEYVAKKNLDKSIVLVGPIWKKEDEERLSKFSNIYLLGAKEYVEAPDYISRFDVGIIPHYINDFIKYTCPMKLYEYLACGISVVTTDAPGVEQFKDVVSVANDFERFNSCINEELISNSQEKVQARLDLIKEHTWKKKVDQMMEHIVNFK